MGARLAVPRSSRGTLALPDNSDVQDALEKRPR